MLRKVHIGHMYWSGGFCRYYGVVELATMRAAVLPLDNPMRHITDEYMDMRPGFVVVERTYSGMSEYVRVYCHKDNMPVNLNPPEEELTQEELCVLYFTRHYKSSYAGMSNYRFRECVRSGAKMSLALWDATKQGLMQKGLLMKNGGLTINGRNRARNLDWNYAEKCVK